MIKKYKHKQVTDSALDVLMSVPVWNKDGQSRMAMTLSCRDTDYIPKVPDAGKVLTIADGVEVQIMHNGLKVSHGGYHGDWMSKIIKDLKGHHEPQEEKIFHEILQRIRPGAVMIELGSFWAYYSLWFHSTVKDAVNICCEPDTANLSIGKTNADLNGYKDLKFYEVASGSQDGVEIDLAMDSDPSNVKKVIVRSVDGLSEENSLDYIDLLHMDIQGYELDALEGAVGMIKRKSLRFLIISTHHYFFSKDPMTHQKCINFIEKHGGHIIAAHTVLESFSGDGVIAASFDPVDIDVKIDISLNHTDDSLFRPYEKDLELLMKAYEEIRRS